MVFVLRTAIEAWPLASAFRISRGAKTTAVVVTVQLSDGVAVGRGEATPYARYGETPEATCRQIQQICQRMPKQSACARDWLIRHVPPGAARNAIDCALWDLAAKRSRTPAWQLAELPRPARALTYFTLSIDTPAAMADAARDVGHLPLLKLKLGAGDGQDAGRMRAVRAARPDARLVADANEGWSAAELPILAAVAAQCGLELIEQPLPANDDGALASLDLPIPICADEAADPNRNLSELVGRYDAVNIKLDKAGGLTHAISLFRQARGLKLKSMLGSMVATSLAMAPAMLLASLADFVDLDSPLLLADDRPGGLRIESGVISPPTARLWG